jgi:molybdenum cofactor sulfurtransferase
MDISNDVAVVPRVTGSVAEDYQAFLRAFPGYSSTESLDAVRATEFERLDRLAHVYLDYTGSSLYGASQIERHARLLLDNVLGNPHSQNLTSVEASKAVREARESVLAFFNASADDYCVVFTGNASHALKLVGESYPFSPSGTFLLTFDNHNSVNGIREFAKSHGASVTYIPIIPPDMRADVRFLENALHEPRSGDRLFAYPAQSNFSGVQHPLEWIAAAQSEGWDVLLDAAAFVATNDLDLRRVKPDFVVLSFYKMFGYPTGIGALLARRPALGKLRRPWFAGGTITVASVGADRHFMASGPSAFEDGTPNFNSFAAVDIGLDFIRQIAIDRIHRRVTALTAWLLERLLVLRHSNGRRLITVYGPETTEARGATIALNFHDSTGGFIDHQVIEAKASGRRISIRAGCFCNPGAGEIALGISADDMKACFARTADRMSYDDFRRCVDGKSSGAVRVSLGVASNFADAHAFVQFAQSRLQ